MTGMCAPWITGPDIVNLRGADFTEGIDGPVLDAAAKAASEVLYVLSGRQFPGPCRATIRPAMMPHGWSVSQWIPFYSLMVGSVYLGAATGTWGWGVCSGGVRGGHHDRRQIDLGVYPIATIHAVTENGVALDPSAYRVDNDRYLIRLDGNDWNMHQDVNLPDGSDGTWSVDVSYGDPLPTPAASAAVALAMEMSKAAMGVENGLPERVTTVSRQGVTWTILDPMAFLENGKTGIYEVDLFLAAYNPQNVRQRSRVLSPDTQRNSRRVGTITGG